MGLVLTGGGSNVEGSEHRHRTKLGTLKVDLRCAKWVKNQAHHLMAMELSHQHPVAAVGSRDKLPTLCPACLILFGGAW